MEVPAAPTGINQDRKVVTNGMTMGVEIRTPVVAMEDITKAISTLAATEVTVTQVIHPTMDLTPEEWDREAVMDLEALATAMAHKDTTQAVNMEAAITDQGHLAAVLMAHLIIVIAIFTTGITREWDAADILTAEHA